MNQTAEHHSETDEEPQCTDLQQAFLEMPGLLEREWLRNGNSRQSPAHEPKRSQVTPRMRSKLLAWIEKLANTTFHFHPSTFLTAALILDQHLSSASEFPATLQMTGCACLLVASKLREPVIVAPESYVAASCNIFSKKQLLQKQSEVYSRIDFKKMREGTPRAVELGCRVLRMEEHVQEALQVLAQLIKEERFAEWSEQRVVYAILALLRTSKQRSIGSCDLDCLRRLL